MPKVDKVCSSEKKVPIPLENNSRSIRPASLIMWTLLGLTGAGVGLNTYKSTVDGYDTNTRIQTLNENLAQSRNTIEELNRFLGNERTTNEHQARQMLGLNQDLENNRQTINKLNHNLREGQNRMNELSRELGTRITLDQFVTAVSMVTPSTVRVEGQFGLGSGVILFGTNGERFILTNGHVTEQNELRRNEFRDGVFHIKVYNGTDYQNPIEFDAAPVILGNGGRAYSNPDTHDLALLAIPPDVKLPQSVTGVRFRNTNVHPLRVGEPVIAVGNPFGERDTVTFGSISHTDRSSDLNINHHVQTDAPINPGNSGGGLFSIRVVDGRPIVELVGINTWGYRGGDGIGGSIRVDYIQKVLNEWGITLRN